MYDLWTQVSLTRIDHPEATVGMVSLPLPRSGRALSVEGILSAQQPVGWWERHRTARRALTFVMHEEGLPETLRLCEAITDAHPVERPWQVTARITREKLDFVPHRFEQIEALRHVPAEDCAIVEFALDLTFGGKTLTLQCGATGPDGGPYWWQNVHVDSLWRNGVAEGVRVGGVVHNGDTYLWADLFLLLFANGVIDASVHFVNTTLHIEGYDFHGVPVFRFFGEDLQPIEATLPADGMQFDLGFCRFNAENAGILCGETHPGRLTTVDGAVHWYPLHCTATGTPAEDAHPMHWPAGMARTVRCQLSLSAAPAAVARYAAPNWWYGYCEEPWSWGFLPVDGQAGHIARQYTDTVSGLMTRGRFDGGAADAGDFGLAGTGLLHRFYHTGEAAFFHAGRDYCDFWADQMVDHRDFSVRQWAGGFGWKTCAYSFFRDLLFGYLETGDPYFYDTMEQCAEHYYAWFRANWPRCNIGRDAFEFSGWAAIQRYFDSDHARERSRELLRMAVSVIQARGVIGGQMGAGPHPGYLSAQYMTGVCLIGMLDVVEAGVQDGETPDPALLPIFKAMSDYYLRDDITWLPCYTNHCRPDWSAHTLQAWTTLALRIYTALPRLYGTHDWMLAGLRQTHQSLLADTSLPHALNRPNDKYLPPRYFDAVLIGATATADGVTLTPLGDPSLWPSRQEVSTPFGILVVSCRIDTDGTTLHFSAPKRFPVSVSYQEQQYQTDSHGQVQL